MRLTDNERAAMRAVVREVLGSGARAPWFGSRVDDAKRGGDIDVFVDVAVSAPNINEEPIHRVARATSVAL